MRWGREIKPVSQVLLYLGGPIICPTLLGNKNSPTTCLDNKCLRVACLKVAEELIEDVEISYKLAPVSDGGA
jgi:hypothetical protein